MDKAPPYPEGVRTVREATFELWKSLGIDKIFSNPGSTEVPLLRDLPREFQFVLGLHEGSVVGMATGYAISTRRPALALLHTTAGLGNAAGAIATARANRAPMVVIVGQQDRRHLVNHPFLAGELTGLVGSYPVSFAEPALASDVPSLIARAWHEAMAERGPAIVVVPMDDWDSPASERRIATPVRIATCVGVTDSAVSEIASMIDTSKSPVLVAGADSDTVEAWEALVALAEELNCPVWQEPFGARAGFPQDHRLFQGHLASGRSRLRSSLAPYDCVVVVGAPAFRQYPFEYGDFVEEGTRVIVISARSDVARVSTAELAVVGPLDEVCLKLATKVRHREVAPEKPETPETPETKAASLSNNLRAGDVFGAIHGRVPADTVIVEESPSSRSQLMDRLPARFPLGFLSAAMGGLGFAMPAAIGMRLADPSRPVIAIVGDGSSMYAIQSLWSAAKYNVGVLFLIMNNGAYAIMDRLAERAAYTSDVWPPLEPIDFPMLAQSLGCLAYRVADRDDLERLLDEVVPSLRELEHPIVIDVAIESDPVFEP